MDVMEKYVMQKVSRKEKSICQNCIHHNLCIAENNQPCFECNRFMDANGVTVQKWVSAEDRLPELGERVICTDGDAVFEQYRVEPSCVYGMWDRFGLKSPMQKVTYWMPMPEPQKGE